MKQRVRRGEVKVLGKVLLWLQEVLAGETRLDVQVLERIWGFLSFFFEML